MTDSSVATSVLAWAGLAAGVALTWRVPTLPPRTASAGTPAVAVVVPARDEEHRLGRLLASLRLQDVTPRSVIVVDDDSQDGTAAAARQDGAVVVASGGPPAGWTGKTWACEVGVRRARELGADVVVLLDADVWLAPDALGRLLDAHAGAGEGSGLLSVQPFHVTERWYEQLSLIPNAVSVMASGMAAIVRPASTRVAFGPCLVTSMRALDAVGGFAAVRADVIEDIALARRYGQSDRPVRCLAGGSAVSFRMYGGGVGELVDGWTKNLAGGAGRAAPGLAIGAALWVAGALAAAGSLLHAPSLAGVVAYGAFGAQVLWIARRLGRFRSAAAIVYPLLMVGFVILFARSLLHRALLRRVTWRGRRIRMHA